MLPLNDIGITLLLPLNDIRITLLLPLNDIRITDVSKCSLYTFYNNPAPLNGSTQFHYCTDSNPGTGADDAFVLKRGVWRNATWPSHSRPAIAASARHFQICFLP